MPVRVVDLDELLDDPLQLTIGGITYTIPFLSVEFAIRLGNVGENPQEGGSTAMLLEILEPLGADKATILAMDARKALAAAYVIMSHFTTLPPKVLALSPTSEAGMAAQRLLDLRGPSSLPPTAAQ